MTLLVAKIILRRWHVRESVWSDGGMTIAKDDRNLETVLNAPHCASGSPERRDTFDEPSVYWRCTNMSKLIVATSCVTENVRFAANWSTATFQWSRNKMRPARRDFKISRGNDAIFKVVYCLRSQVVWWTREVVGASAPTYRKNKNRTRNRSPVP
jgi:hypothetical protein